MNEEISVDSRGHGPRVLVVEDDEMNARLTTHVLRRAGCSVMRVADGAAAVAAARDGFFDLVLLDLDLPDMPGVDVARAIRASQAAWIPVVALTASAEDVPLLVSSGIDRHLAKPLREELVREVLAALAPRPSAVPSPPTVAPEVRSEATAAVVPLRRTPHAAKVLDVEDLRARAGRDDDLVHELLVDFADEIDRAVATLRAVLAGGDELDRDELARRAHRLRGGFLAGGAYAAAEVAGELEIAAREAPFETLALVASAVEHAASAAQAAARAYTQAPRASGMR